jgi:16S rRNA (cytosine967-C5)-methyltransferase
MNRYGTSTTPKTSREDRQPVMDILESLPQFSKLSVRDRAFCRLLVTTTERRMGQIDKVIDFCCNKGKNGISITTREQTSSPSSSTKPKRLDPLLRNVLRLGIAQILFARVPAHAAVQETVELLRHNNGDNGTNRNRRRKPVVAEPKIKFVNAVLRRVTRTGVDTILEDAGASYVGLNAAPWLVHELRAAWGTEAADRIVQSAMKETPRCLTLLSSWNPDGSDANSNLDPHSRQQQAARFETISRHFQQEFDPTGIAASTEPVQLLPQGSMRVLCPPPGPVRSWPLYDAGVWWLQDVSATLPALAIRSAFPPAASEIRNLTAVDLCAAPGGKTAQLCDMRIFTHVYAVEQSPARCRRLIENMDRLGLAFHAVVADGTTWKLPGGAHSKAQAVLLDVPCTATGTASKRPDVLRRSENYHDLLNTQLDLALNAIDSIVDVGGVLVYATCSLLKQESEYQIERLLETYQGSVEMFPFAEGELPGFDSAIDRRHGWLRVLPGDPKLVESGVHPCDGFFVARLRKTR